MYFSKKFTKISLMKLIIPAILSNNLTDFEEKLKKVNDLSSWLQIDIADNHFVPNQTLFPRAFKNIKIEKNLEIHLMTFNPEKYFLDCQKIDAKRVIFHLEAVDDPLKILTGQKNYSFQLGLAINPKTPLEKVVPYLNYFNFLLFLGVEPGFQGQCFQSKTLDKIEKIKKNRSEIIVEVDGGINENNIEAISAAGADIFVVGSALLKAKNPKKIFNQLMAKISKKKV